MWKKILIALLVLFVAIQFVRPQKNASATPPGKDDFIVRLAPPPEVRHLLEVGCYDCHSDNTRYPWYANIQPVAWWLDKHITEGKGQLDFSIFGELSRRKQGKAIEDISDQISDHTMPLKSYTWIHKDAVFTEAQTKLLTDWLAAAQDKLEDAADK